MNGTQELEQLDAAGFSPDEQHAWAIDRRRELSDAGFNEREVNSYFGVKEFNQAPIKAYVDETMKTATQATVEGGTPKPVTDFMDALKAGFGESVTGLLTGKPTVTVSSDAPRSSKIASYTATLAGDLPAIIGGAFVGGTATGPLAPVGAMAGAFALPAGMRRILMDKYEKGEVQGFGDFWDRFSGAFIDTAKGWVTGAATGAVGKGIGLLPIASPTAKTIATVSGEIATMVTIGNALEGRIPEPNDFIDTALTLGFVKGSVKVVSKLRNIYAETGVRPDDVAADIMRDPTILHDLMAEDTKIPKAYQAEAPPPQLQQTKPKDRFLLALRGEFPIPEVKGKDVLLLPDKREPLSRMDLAVTARHEMPIDQNAEMLARAEKALADVEMAGAERGGRYFQEQYGHGSTDDVTGLKSATAGWYKEATTGERKLSRQRVEVALNKIIDNKGRDVGTDVQRVKELILGDAEYEQSPFAPRTEEEWVRARQYAVVEWEPDIAMGGGVPPRTPVDIGGPTVPPPANLPIGTAQKAVLDRLALTDPKTEKLTLSDLYTSVVDNLNPVLKVQKEGGKADLPTGENPYELERLTRGIAGKASEFLNAGAFDFRTYKTTTKGYFKILEPVKNDLDGFRAYMVAKRAIEKARQGVETGIPLEEAKTVVKEGKAKYEAVHQERIAYRNAMLDTLKQSGILSADAVDAMKEANKDYVPFYRFLEDEQGRPLTSKQVKNPVKRMTGSERQILDPIISDIKDTFLFVGLAEKNAARQAYVNLGPEFAEKQAQPLHMTRLTEPEIERLFKEFVTTVKHTKRTQTEQTETTETGGVAGQEPPGKAIQLVTARVKEALKARGFSTGETDQMVSRIAAGGKGADHTTVKTVIREIERTVYMPELDIRLPHEVATVFRAMQAPVKADEVAVFTNGHRDLYTVDPKVAEAFNGLDAGPTSLLAKIAYAPASLLRAGVTITPDFITRNIIRDAVSSFIYAGSNPIKTALGLKSIVTKDTAFHNWMKGGGANATLVAIDRDYLASQIGELDSQTGLMRRAWNVATTPFDLLRATSELVENSTRIGAVRSELQRAKTKAQIQALSLIAREVTVDFARHGKDTQGYARSTAFFNPAIQGIDRLFREAKEHPLRMTAKAVASVTLPSVLLWYANRDDEEIQNLPRWQKDLFWVTRVPLPEGKSFILRIPKPQEFGIIFGTIPERLLDEFVKHDPNAMRDIHKTILDAFTPSLIPTAAMPIISQFANRDTFRGHPLIPAGSEKLLPEYQYTPYTSELAKAMGHVLGAFPGMEKASLRGDDQFIGGTARALTSPILLENYLRSWTGGMGMYLLQLADKGLREAGALPDPAKPAAALSDIPFVRAFVVRYPASTAQSIQDFYSDYDASKIYFDTIMSLAEQGDTRALSLIQAHSEDIVQLSDIREALTEKNKIIRMIDKNPEIPPDEKRQIIDTLYYRMIEFSHAGNVALRTLSATIKKRQEAP